MIRRIYVFWPTYFGAFLNWTPLDLRSKFFQTFSAIHHRISRRLHALNHREILSGIKPCFIDDTGFPEIAYTFFIPMLALIGVTSVRIFDLFSVAVRIQMNVNDSYRKNVSKYIAQTRQQVCEKLLTYCSRTVFWVCATICQLVSHK